MQVAEEALDKQWHKFTEGVGGQPCRGRQPHRQHVLRLAAWHTSLTIVHPNTHMAQVLSRTVGMTLYQGEELISSEVQTVQQRQFTFQVGWQLVAPGMRGWYSTAQAIGVGG